MFHDYACYDSQRDDSWARKHIHGLDAEYLDFYGFRNSQELTSKLNDWLTAFPEAVIYDMYPHRLQESVNRPISNVNYKSWEERRFLACHKEALRMKLNGESVNGTVCLHDAHCRFESWPYNRYIRDLYINDFKWRCALYNCVELFLFKKWTI